MTRNHPSTSPAPNPSSIFMPPTTSSSPSGSTGQPTPLPKRPLPDDEEQREQQDGQGERSGRKDDDDDDNTFPLPKLRLHIQDAMHPGASRFLAAVDAPALLSRSVQTVLRLLYVSPQKHRAHDEDEDKAEEDGTTMEQQQQQQQQQSPTSPTTRSHSRSRPSRPHYTPPPTRSVTLFLEDMDGVAYTQGMDLDDDHKEIHLSMGYVKGIRRAPAPSPSPAPTANQPTTTTKGDIAGAYEIEGVLVHELVHCFQYNGRGKCPGGLVEGIADWVRLSARLGAPHWRRDAVPDRWDQGYERTAYFLDWLERRFGRGTVRRMNEALRVREYKQTEFWTGLFGYDVDVLWKEYLKTLKKDGRD
ncbi:plant Basic Secretory protein [Diaporthe helianthi]|uniref:Plant Basic Secretory protein n=1 Tax=Diaporthe helianthi TaxID=158607 RepID=A0A2P5I713_DIAHE|nr:plant Basic Secretory protein [Diaporthe helianthi]